MLRRTNFKAGLWGAASAIVTTFSVLAVGASTGVLDLGNLVLDDSNTAPDAIVWNPTVDQFSRGPVAIGQNLATFYESYPGERDPVIFMGYNHLIGGVPYNTRDGAAYWAIEGNFRPAPDLPPMMEGYLHFVEVGSAVGHRPIFVQFRKDINEVSNVSLTGGAQALGQISFWQKAAGGDGALNATFKSREWTMLSNAGKGDMILELKAPGGSNHSRIFLGSAAVDRSVYLEARNDTHAFLGFYGKSPLHIRKVEGDSGEISVLGIGGNQKGAVLGVTQQNARDDMPALMVTPKASSTTPAVRFNDPDGHQRLSFDLSSPAEPVLALYESETRLNPVYKLHKNGHVTVRESGNLSVDRAPGTGSAALSPSWTNKPGLARDGTPKWFPMVDSSGDLYWVPGFKH